MRIISWNCNGAFRKKYKEILSYNADVYIIQECEDPLLSNSKDYKLWANNYLWIGDNKNKGLGVFCKSNINLEVLDWSNNYNNSTVKYFLPVKVDGIQLLAVWLHNNNSPTFGYIGQLWKYLEVNLGKLNDETIIAGDWNSNKIWDKWDRWWNHTDVLNSLKTKSIYSVYHQCFKEAQGEELLPTFFLQRNINKPYHIDYILAGSKLLEKEFTINIGDFQKWIALSDHLPLVFDLNN